jgi:hypothetical protein
MARKPVPFDADDLIERYASGESGLSVARSALARGIGGSTLSGARAALKRACLARGIHVRDKSEGETLKWSRMSPEGRANQVRAAHDAVRGVKHSWQRQLDHARYIESRGILTESEAFLAELLAERGLTVVPQQAIGPYNCDLGASPVAVEVLGGYFHLFGPRLTKYLKRTRYILDAGWHVLMLIDDVRRFPIGPASADYVVAYVEDARRNPAALREYRVVRGAGKLVACGSAKDDDISFVMTLGRGDNPPDRRDDGALG